MRQRKADRVKQDVLLMQLVIASTKDSKGKVAKQLAKLLKGMDESD